MAKTEGVEIEGTPGQLTAWLGQRPDMKLYRLVEVTEAKEEPTPTIDPMNAASIALLQSWIAEAPTDPEAIREAEEDLREFKLNLNRPRKETGARLHFPEVE